MQKYPVYVCTLGKKHREETDMKMMHTKMGIKSRSWKEKKKWIAILLNRFSLIVLIYITNLKLIKVIDQLSFSLSISHHRFRDRKAVPRQDIYKKHWKVLYFAASYHIVNFLNHRNVSVWIIIDEFHFAYTYFKNMGKL